jgi:hypothetical protein
MTKLLLLNFFQQLAHGLWSHGDDQQISQFDRPPQIPFHDHAILQLEFFELRRMPVMYNDGALVSRAPQSRNKRVRNASSAEKHCGLH